MTLVPISIREKTCLDVDVSHDQLMCIIVHKRVPQRLRVTIFFHIDVGHETHTIVQGNAFW